MNTAFTYDGDGKRVKSVLTTNIATTITYFAGAYYEVANGVVTKYYYAGSQRIAMRNNGDLKFLLGDHLGSTSLVTDTNGQNVTETRYTAWGEVRYASGTTPTKYTYTGQYSYTADFGLMFFNARWVDMSLGRFAQADSIVPDGIQGLDRYAYVNNSPAKYTDPSGHKCIPEDECRALQGVTYSNKPSTVISEIEQPDGLTPDGLMGYNGLMYISNMKDSWWNDDGKLTLDEALAMLLFKEFSVAIGYSCDENGNCPFSLPKDAKTAVTVKWQQYCSGGWSSSSCFNGFWGYFQPTRQAPTSAFVRNALLGYNIHDPSRYGGGVYIREANSILSSPRIPMTNNTKTDWAAVKVGSSVHKALMAYGIDTYKWSEDGVSWVLFIVSQEEQSNICQMVISSSACNLSTIQ
ncbi:MAG: RHS repeat-associated core domain-containing protein [Anaerolineales bacterium]